LARSRSGKGSSERKKGGIPPAKGGISLKTFFKVKRVLYLGEKERGKKGVKWIRLWGRWGPKVLPGQGRGRYESQGQRKECFFGGGGKRILRIEGEPRARSGRRKQMEERTVHKKPSFLLVLKGRGFGSVWKVRISHRGGRSGNGDERKYGR